MKKQCAVDGDELPPETRCWCCRSGWRWAENLRSTVRESETDGAAEPSETAPEGQKQKQALLQDLQTGAEQKAWGSEI